MARGPFAKFGLALWACFFLNSCSTTHQAAPNQAALEAANKWWRQVLDAPVPEKAGTVTPAHKITTKTGKVLSINRHVQTKAEESEQMKDWRWANHVRAIVKGFSTDSNTFVILTSLTGADINDAQELCHIAGGFIWAGENQKYGLDNIKVLGSSGELLSSRFGLQGRVN